jgi:AraC-like DNA-binding protein
MPQSRHTRSAQRAPRRGLVRAGAFRAAPGLLTELVGARAHGILQRAGLRTDLSPEAMLGFEAAAQLLEDAADATNRDDIAIQFASQISWADLGVLGYVLIHSPTVGVAIANVRRYFIIQQRAGVFSLDIEGEQAHFTYRLRLAPHEPPRQHALAILAMFIRLVREGIGDPTWAPRSVTLPFGKPLRRSAERAFFGAPIEYNASVASIVMSTATLREPIVAADPGLLPILVRHADECLARLPALDDDLLGEARRLVASMLGTSAISLEEVANRLGTSARSFQRHLSDEDLSFKQLVDEVRLGMARRHLADPAMSLTETAFMLGYSELSAFSRAFRRWTGKSAQAYRRAQLR